MGYPTYRVGLATLACAVLSGVQPAELVDASVADDVVELSFATPTEELVRQVRRLSTNSTGGLSTGSWAAIIAGAVALAILVVATIWYFMCRKPPMYTNTSKGYAAMKQSEPVYGGEIEVPDAQARFGPSFFRAGASAGGENPEMPLLTLKGTAHGAC
jgi:hypothetical protein